MLEELQIETNAPEVESTVQSASTEQEANATKVESSDSATETHTEDKGNVQNRINKLTAEKYAAAREAEELRNKLAELEAKSAKPVESKSELIEPDLPVDIYDEDAMRKYHKDVAAYNRKVAAEEARNYYNSTNEQQKKAESEKSSRESQTQLVNQYAERGLKSGLTIEQMQLNENVIVQHGINPDVGMFIMGDEQGALIANHLANNPESLDKLNSMSATQAAVYIHNTIKPSVAAPRTVTAAPDPIESINGGGSREKDDFERLCPGAIIESA